MFRFGFFAWNRCAKKRSFVVSVQVVVGFERAFIPEYRVRCVPHVVESEQLTRKENKEKRYIQAADGIASAELRSLEATEKAKGEETEFIQ